MAVAPRAAIYVRVSTASQEEGTSLESQEAACRAYADEHGYEIEEAHVYVEVHTGAELWERPRLTTLREAVRQNAADIVVAYALDRLSRDQRHVAVILAEAENAGVSVEFVTERLEDTAEGRLLLSIKGYLAEAEREKIRERTGRGRRSRVESGRPLAGPRPPFGYRWRPDEIVPGRNRPIPKPGLELDPLTVPIVRRIFSQAVVGKSQHKIAAELNAEGVPTPSGRGSGKWQQSSVHHILTNPFYVGRAAGLRVAVVKERGNKVRRLRPEDQHIPLPEHAVPALVDAAAFDSLQERFRLNKLRAVRNNREPDLSLLRGGYVRCGHCDAPMFVHRTTKYRNYRCGRQNRVQEPCEGAVIAVDLADAWAWARVEAILTKPETIAAELARLRREDPTEQDLALVDRQLVTVERQQRNLVDNLGMLDPESADLVRQQLAALSARRQQLTAERATIAERRRTWEEAQSRLGELQAWCRRVGSRLSRLSYYERRLALDALVGCQS